MCVRNKYKILQKQIHPHTSNQKILNNSLSMTAFGSLTLYHILYYSKNKNKQKINSLISNVLLKYLL